MDELVWASEWREQEWQQIVNQACQNYQTYHCHLTEQIQVAQLEAKYMMDTARSLACSILPTGAYE